jgi:hypothetical protein
MVGNDPWVGLERELSAQIGSDGYHVVVSDAVVIVTAGLR